MSTAGRISIGIAAIVVVSVAVAIWLIRGPDPLDFAEGEKVALADYRATDPTGVPASLAQASLVERGAYLARAADCLVCHTTEGGKAYAGGLGFQAAVRDALFDHITPDKETGIGNYSDQDFLNAVHRGIRRDGGTALPCNALYFLHLHHRCGRTCHQGLSVQPTAGEEPAARQYALVSVQSALGHDLLVGAVQSRRAVHAG